MSYTFSRKTFAEIAAVVLAFFCLYLLFSGLMSNSKPTVLCAFGVLFTIFPLFFDMGNCIEEVPHFVQPIMAILFLTIPAGAGASFAAAMNTEGFVAGAIVVIVLFAIMFLQKQMKRHGFKII